MREPWSKVVASVGSIPIVARLGPRAGPPIHPIAQITPQAVEPEA